MGNSKSKNKEEPPLKKSTISSDKIDKFVDDFLLKNKDINIDYLPDYVEKQIYKNMFIYLMNMTTELIENSKIVFLGHEISITIKPIEQNT